KHLIGQTAMLGAGGCRKLLDQGYRLFTTVSLHRNRAFDDDHASPLLESGARIIAYPRPHFRHRLSRQRRAGVHGRTPAPDPAPDGSGDRLCRPDPWSVLNEPLVKYHADCPVWS